MAVLLDPEGHEVAALFAAAPGLAGARVLEIGCGDGRLTRRYAERAAAVLAIDRNADRVEAGRSAFPSGPAGRVELRAEAFEDLAAADRSFDVVILSWSL